MKKIKSTKKEIMKYLLNEYQKKGKNFFFRSQNIPSKKSVQIIGRTIGELKKEGNVILWSNHKGKSPKLWRTNFK